MDKEISQDNMRNREDGWYIAVTTEYYQIGRRNQYSNHRDQIHNSKYQQ